MPTILRSPDDRGDGHEAIKALGEKREPTHMGREDGVQRIL